MPSIFRQTSLERVASPEQLDDYIRVSNPSVWMILAAIVLLLAGALVWACVGTITVTAPAAVVVHDGTALCYVSQDRASEIAPGDEVRAGGATGTVILFSDTPVSAAEVSALAGSAAAQVVPTSSWAAVADVSIGLADGVYEADIVTDAYHPIALLFGGA